MARILVCGGRDYRNHLHLSQVMSEASSEFGSKDDPVTVIHGGARGADDLAGQWAELNDLAVEVYPANWKADGKAAGPIRNSRMLTDGKPDLVIAFPGGRGTADMISKAKRAGILVREIVRI